MFVSQEKNNNKKRLHKPNILRRKSKAPANAFLTGTIVGNQQMDNVIKYNCVKPFQIVKTSMEGFSFENNISYCPMERNQDIAPKLDPKHSSNQDVFNESSLLVNIVNYSEENPVQSSVNVESFFNDGANGENMLFKIDSNKETQTIVLLDKESHVNGLFNEQTDDFITSMVPMSAVTTSSNKALPKSQGQAITVVPPQQLFESNIFTQSKFKCEVPNCNKEFKSEQKYKRHKNIHNKDGSIREPRQVTSECPVKKVCSDGTQQKCGKIYLVREQLLKHLNEDHTIEDAAYRCEQCGRQFFWVTGLKAHARTHEQRPRPAASLVCGWPGCGRVFSQPCRLREHARAHTGDRPYPCRFPNCGASFRSASKLERHARRHSDLRRHACSTCGRGFLRREHLREHVARHQDRRDLHTERRCPQQESDQVSKEPAVQEHINSAHATEESAPAAPPDVAENNLDYIFLAVESDEGAHTEQQQTEANDGVDLEEAAQTGVAADESMSLESRAARTHCPWPLETRFHPVSDLVLEEDAGAEQPEGSESNIYTVRSDLFLHGNVLINEDSVQMGSAVETAETATESGAPNDELGLGLLEHPHIDLMQEEMMFTVWQ